MATTAKKIKLKVTDSDQNIELDEEFAKMSPFIKQAIEVANRNLDEPVLVNLKGDAFKVLIF